MSITSLNRFITSTRDDVSTDVIRYIYCISISHVEKIAIDVYMYGYIHTSIYHISR